MVWGKTEKLSNEETERWKGGRRKWDLERHTFLYSHFLPVSVPLADALRNIDAPYAE